MVPGADGCELGEPMTTKLIATAAAAVALALWPASGEASHTNALGECTRTALPYVNTTPISLGPITVPSEEPTWTKCRDWFTAEAPTSARMQAVVGPGFTGSVTVRLCLYNSSWTVCDQVLDHDVRFVAGVAVDAPAADVELPVGTWELMGSYATRSRTTPSISRCYYPGPCIHVVPSHTVETSESIGSFAVSVVPR